MDEIEKQVRANKIFRIIKDFETLLPDEFEKCGIVKCGHCNGTGISNKHTLVICRVCGGMGYRGFEKLYGEYICRTCNGFGCDRCDKRGIVDWIKHANGNDMPMREYA